MPPAGTELLLRDRRATLTSPSHQRRCDVRTPLPSHPPIHFICRMQIKLLAQKKKKKEPLMCWDDSRVHPQFFFFLSFLFLFYFCTLCLSCFFFGGGVADTLEFTQRKQSPGSPTPPPPPAPPPPPPPPPRSVWREMSERLTGSLRGATEAPAESFEQLLPEPVESRQSAAWVSGS